MFRNLLTAFTLFAVFATAPAIAQEPRDHLGVPGPISVGGTEYRLSWSSRPSKAYTKQEYLPAGSAKETYGSMVMVEFLETNGPLSEAVSAQAAMIEQRKATDPVANMAVLQNADKSEILLDFLLSAKDEKGEYIVEWNAYRYVKARHGGKSGTLLFAISERAYGNAQAQTFLRGLRDMKAKRIGELTSVAMPKPK